LDLKLLEGAVVLELEWWCSGASYYSVLLFNLCQLGFRVTIRFWLILGSIALNLILVVMLILI
jgi:hypothetical protein